MACPSRFTRATLSTWIALLAAPALAHDMAVGPNGGRVVEAVPHHVELVVKARAVTVFVTDAAHKPVALTGFKGVAVLTADGKTQRIVLAPQDGVRLTGIAFAALPDLPKGVIQMTRPDGTTLQGQFR